MKNLWKLFGLSIVLSIANLHAFEKINTTPSEEMNIAQSEKINVNPSKKIYVNREDIIIEDDGHIYLRLEDNTWNVTLKPITAIYSDEQGMYILDQDASGSTILTP
ncbi:MAG: hypothetical protein LBC45_01400 [Chlamydiales bacterium]|jgi:hypothetical protein|nr:hypothetical protein [Chlamydiales bacterium]